VGGSESTDARDSSNFGDSPAVTAGVAYDILSTVGALDLALQINTFDAIEPKNAHAA
jgi:hypothetical protein